MRLATAFLLALTLAAPARAQWETIRDAVTTSTSPFWGRGDLAVYRGTTSGFDSLHVSTDAGATFTRRSTPDAGLGIIWGDGERGADLLIGGVCPGPTCLMRSTDGLTWTAIPTPASGPTGLYGTVRAVAGIGNTLIAVTQPNTGTATSSTLWRSTDGGGSWAYPSPAAIEGLPVRLAVYEGRFVLVMGGDGRGRLYTSDDGASWTAPVDPDTPSIDPAFDGVSDIVESGGALFLSSRDNGFYRSDNAGQTWARVVTNLGFQRPHTLVSLGDGGLLGVVVDQHMASTDFGATWTPSCPAYRRPNDSNFYLASDLEQTNEYILGRFGGWVARISYAACGLAAPPVAAEGAPSETALAVTASPNPTRGHVRLAVTVPEAGPARLAVLDALGREVAVAHDGPLPAGSLDLDLDVSALAPGLYVIRLGAGSGVVSRTLTVVR